MLQVRRVLEASLEALSRELRGETGKPSTVANEPPNTANKPPTAPPSFRRRGPRQVELTGGAEIKRIFELLDEYISMYSFVYEHLKDYHLNVRDIFSLDYIRENSKDNRGYIAERIAQKMDALNGSFLKYKNVKNRYEQYVEKGIKKRNSMKTLKRGEPVEGRSSTEKSDKVGGNSVPGERHLSLRNLRKKEFPEMWEPTWHSSSHSFLSEEDQVKKDELNEELIQREDEYLKRLQKVVKLLTRYKKLKNKKIKIKHIVNIGKVEVHPILFNLKLRKDQMVGFYRSILLFGKIFVVKRIVFTLKMKISFLGRVTPSAFLLNNRFLLLLYETHLDHLRSSYQIGVNKDFCHDLTLENLDGMMKQGDLSHLLLKYVIYMFGLNSAFMSARLGVDIGHGVSSDYIGGSNAANNGDGDFGEDDPHWGANNLRVVYELAKNFIRTPLLHAADFFRSSRASPNGESNTQDEQLESPFRQIHSYFSSIFNSDEISGHILKKFESWEESSSSGCYDGHSCSIDSPIYSKDVIKKSIFYNLNDIGDEFDMINEATVTSVSSCTSSLYSYASSSPLKFPFHLLNNALMKNSLSEAYKYMLYKMQESQAFKLYSRIKRTNMTLLETIFLHLILNFGMTPYNKLKGTMVNSFCRKKGRGGEDGTSSKAHAGPLQYRKRERNLDMIPHIRYVPNGEQLQAGLSISCSEVKQKDENDSYNKTHTKWWNSNRGRSYSSSNNNAPSQRMHQLVDTCDLLNRDKKKITSFKVKHIEYIPNGASLTTVIEKQNAMSDYELYGLFFQGVRGEEKKYFPEESKKKDFPEDNSNGVSLKEDMYCSEEKIAYFTIGQSAVYPSGTADVEEPFILPMLSKSLASQKEILFERESMEQYNMVLSWLHRSQDKKNWNREKVRKIERDISSLSWKAKLYEENISYVKNKMEQMKRPPQEGSDQPSDLQKEYQREVSNAAQEKYNSLIDIYKDIVEMFRERNKNLTKLKKENEREGEKEQTEEEPGVNYYGLSKYSLLRKHQVEDLNTYTFYNEQIMKYFQKQNRCCDAYIKEMKIHLEFFPQLCCSNGGERDNEKKMHKYIYISITDLLTDFIRCENNTNSLLTNLKKIKDTIHTINTVNANLHRKQRTFHLSTKYFYREKKRRTFISSQIKWKI